MTKNAYIESDTLQVQDPHAREYLSTRSGIVLAPSTVETYDNILCLYESYLSETDSSILEADLRTVIDYIEYCVRRGNRESTLRSKLSVLSELYRFIKLRSRAGSELNLDPLCLREIDLSKYRTPQPIARGALTHAEIGRLLDAIDSYRNRLMVKVAIATGIRNSDLRSLRIEDLDFAGLTVHIPNPKYGRPYDVPIQRELAFEIEFWLTHHRPGIVGTGENPFVFPSQSGGQLETNNSFTSIVVEAAERAGIQDSIGISEIFDEGGSLDLSVVSRSWNRVTPHTLRHSFVTLLNEAGIGLADRQRLANHTRAETTLRYTHSEDVGFEKIRSQYKPHPSHPLS